MILKMKILLLQQNVEMKEEENELRNYNVHLDGAELWILNCVEVNSLILMHKKR